MYQSAIASAVFAAFFWGQSSLAGVSIARRVSASISVFWWWLPTLASLPVFYLLGARVLELSGSAWLWVSAATLARLLGQWFYRRALALPESSLSVALASTYTLPAILVLALLGQQVSPVIVGAATLIVVGMLLGKQALRGGLSGVRPALLTCLCWTGFSIFQWKAAVSAPVMDLLFASGVVTVLSCLALGAFIRGRGGSLRIDPKTLSLVCLGWLSLVLASACLFWALPRGNAAQVMAISATYPLVTTAGSLLLKQERWNRGIAISVLLLTLGAALAASA